MQETTIVLQNPSFIDIKNIRTVLELGGPSGSIPIELRRESLLQRGFPI